jgi:hypothetical protein
VAKIDNLSISYLLFLALLLQTKNKLFTRTIIPVILFTIVAPVGAMDKKTSGITARGSCVCLK